MCAKSSLRKSGKVVMTFLILVDSVSCQWLASAASVGLANAGPYKILVRTKLTESTDDNESERNGVKLQEAVVQGIRNSLMLSIYKLNKRSLMQQPLS